MKLDFPQLGIRSAEALVLPMGWHLPQGSDPVSGLDSAVLQLLREAPGLRALPVASRASCNNLGFVAYGFPDDRPEGDAAHGKLGVVVAQAWVRVEADSGAAIEPGFSGGPAWSPEANGAVAIIVARRKAETSVAFAVPLARLVAEIPPLAAALRGRPGSLDWLSHAPAGLQSDLIDYSGLIEDRTTDFVGREFVFEAIDKRMAHASCGYILVRGEPGIGKTALMARLASTRGWPHHFNIAPENLRSPAHFLRNICAQVILRYRLPRDRLPDNVDADARALKELLIEAAPSAGDPLVLLVDALDEAEVAAAGVNRLYLPRDLPPHVFVVVTIRPNVEEQIDSAQRLEPITLDEDGDGNRRDVLSYVRSFVQRQQHRRAQLLAPWKGDEEDMVADLAKRSEGNFMYLRHVLPMVSSGQLVGGLPQGLLGYYQRHWDQMRMRQSNRFSRMHKPVLAYLALAREAVTADDIAGWMTNGDAFEVQELIAEWGEFLHEVPDTPTRWRLYHNSFLDFLSTKLKLQDYRRLQAQAMERKIDLDGYP